MNHLIVLSPTPPDDLEAAALAAALALALAAAPAAGPEERDPHRATWHDASKLSQQGLRPARTGVLPCWSTIERLRQRAAGGFTGIVGL